MEQGTSCSVHAPVRADRQRVRVVDDGVIELGAQRVQAFEVDRIEQRVHVAADEHGGAVFGCATSETVCRATLAKLLEGPARYQNGSVAVLRQGAQGEGAVGADDRRGQQTRLEHAIDVDCAKRAGARRLHIGEEARSEVALNGKGRRALDCERPLERAAPGCARVFVVDELVEKPALLWHGAELALAFRAQHMCEVVLLQSLERRVGHCGSRVEEGIVRIDV